MWEQRSAINHKRQKKDSASAINHKRRKKDLKKGLHDIARNDSRNEYFAGGQSEEGGGSATVLVWPDEDDGENKTDTAAEPEEPVEKFTGAGRKL